MTESFSDEQGSTLMAQEKRQRLYDRGEYKLSDTEGFFCRECDWRGLTAPANHSGTIDERLKGDVPLVVCPECESGAYTKESDIDHLEAFEEEYIIDE